jgi:hypothetical protein
MKKFMLAALAILGVAIGSASLTTPANAYNFAPAAENAGANS